MCPDDALRRTSHADRSRLLAVGSHLGNAFSNPGVIRRDELALVLWSSPTPDLATRPTCHTGETGSVRSRPGCAPAHGTGVSPNRASE
jgi:hypothetical protein